MAEMASNDRGAGRGCQSNSKSSSSSGSDESSTEEERLRRLFQACDRDGDGFIDRSVMVIVVECVQYTFWCLLSDRSIIKKYKFYNA